MYLIFFACKIYKYNCMHTKFWFTLSHIRGMKTGFADWKQVSTIYTQVGYRYLNLRVERYFLWTSSLQKTSSQYLYYLFKYLILILIAWYQKYFFALQVSYKESLILHKYIFLFYFSKFRINNHINKFLLG